MLSDGAWRLHASSSHKRCEEPTARAAGPVMLPEPLLCVGLQGGPQYVHRLHRLAKRHSGGWRRMSVEHEPSVTAVFSRSPNSAWVVRSLFTCLQHDVRGVRGGVP